MDYVVPVVLVSAIGVYFFGSLVVKGFAFFKGVYKRKFIDPERLEYIKRHRFNSALEHKVRELYPGLSASDVEKVFDGLRQFFLVAHLCKKRSGYALAVDRRHVASIYSFY